MGDFIVELNGNRLGPEVTEADLVQMLHQLGRPITLGFARGVTNQRPHTIEPSFNAATSVSHSAAVEQSSLNVPVRAQSRQEQRKATAADTSSEEEQETPVNLPSSSEQLAARVMATNTATEDPSAPPADVAAVVASASHNTNHARAMGSSRSNSATSSGVSGGGAGGGNILAAQLADPAANAKTKRDFERRGGLPTAVSTSIFAKNADLLFLYFILSPP